jgi:hypothetical protein
MIVDIECEDGTTQIARTVLENQDNYVVQFLDTKLFTRYPQGYDLIDDSDDETFECSETDEEDSEDESLVDEDET